MNKEKQIDDMAKILCFDYGGCDKCSISNPLCETPCTILDDCEALYNAGYRKQREGEWETIPDYSNSLITYRHICSECKAFYKDIIRHGHKYCHECGAKMKGE